mmetsp:Transcript_30091/g.50877  ORF Transcript_30091/g.50877 Transcript_30091/m.50877 type:complete len:82 (+) Transcript_30091:108-353(+)
MSAPSMFNVMFANVDVPPSKANKRITVTAGANEAASIPSSVTDTSNSSRWAHVTLPKYASSIGTNGIIANPQTTNPNDEMV